MIDHLLYATPDLRSSVDDLDERFGAELSPGGRHFTLGTRNFLADLGDRTYLEVLGPDLDQPKPAAGWPLGIGQMTRPRLLAWAARVADLDKSVRLAAARGCAYDSIVRLSRDREDGVRLTWRMAAPSDGQAFDGVMPLLIRWETDAYAAELSTKSVRLVSLRMFHPDAATVGQHLAALDCADQVTVEQASKPALSAVLRTPAGEVELR